MRPFSLIGFRAVLLNKHSLQTAHHASRRLFLRHGECPVPEVADSKKLRLRMFLQRKRPQYTRFAGGTWCISSSRGSLITARYFRITSASSTCLVESQESVCFIHFSSSPM